MFFRIPKKDQQRRKTNNIILLIFILPATMFFSSNVNNVLAVTEGIDAFWEKANMTHPEAMYTPDISDENTVPSLKDVDSYDMIPTVYINTNQLTHEGKALDEFIPFAFPYAEQKMLYFDKIDPITSVAPGTVRISASSRIK